MPRCRADAAAASRPAATGRHGMVVSPEGHASRAGLEALRAGGTAVMVMDDWGVAVDPAKVEEALKANPDAYLGPLTLSGRARWKGRVLRSPRTRF